MGLWRYGRALPVSSPPLPSPPRSRHGELASLAVAAGDAREEVDAGVGLWSCSGVPLP
ncbi:unnamed protein product [Urochloa humidicola]